MKGYQITFFTQRNRRQGHQGIEDWLRDLAKSLGIRGLTVTTSADGIGRSGRLDSNHFFELTDQPIQATMVLVEAQFQALFERLAAEQANLFYVRIPAEFGVVGEVSCGIASAARRAPPTGASSRIVNETRAQHARTEPPVEQIELALARIENSDAFRNSPRHRALLRHLVARSLEADHAALKETVIAVEVFGRSAARFDPKLDTIVRVEARRLRARLSDYYRTDGRDTALRIQLPVGSYVPLIAEREPP